MGATSTSRKANAIHLVDTLQSHYDITIDWDGKQYLGLTLD